MDNEGREYPLLVKLTMNNEGESTPQIKLTIDNEGESVRH